MVTVPQLLTLEARYPGHPPAKYDAIRALGLTEARFYQLLLRAAASVEGQEFDAMTAHRVNRLRASATLSATPLIGALSRR